MWISIYDSTQFTICMYFTSITKLNWIHSIMLDHECKLCRVGEPIWYLNDFLALHLQAYLTSGGLSMGVSKSLKITEDKFVPSIIDYVPNKIKGEIFLSPTVVESGKSALSSLNLFVYSAACSARVTDRILSFLVCNYNLSKDSMDMSTGIDEHYH